MTVSTSPSFSFLPSSFFSSSPSFFSSASNWNSSVRMVSFTTLKEGFPSLRKTVPKLLETVAQPSTLSRTALHFTRVTFVNVSRTGPSRTSTTSLVSSLRWGLLVVTGKTSIKAVSLITLKNCWTVLQKTAFDKEDSPSSQSFKNTSSSLSESSSMSSGSGSFSGTSGERAVGRTSPAFGAGVIFSFSAAASVSFSAASPSLASPSLASSALSSSFFSSASSFFSSASGSSAAGGLKGLSSLSADSSQAASSSWSISPSPFLSKAAKSASLPQPRIRWLYRTTLRAKTLSFSASTVRFLKACSRNLEDRFVVRPSRGSILPIRISSCLACEARKACKSLAKRASKPSPSVSICFLDCVTEALASLMTSSTSSASSIIAEADMAFAFSCKGWTFCSAMPTALSASSTVNEASLILSANSFFRP
mmetsp:Transcript_60457/g.158465  ORF Transcript_60457/g.158465 Transcript_60457/m.158465 type:complete len:422 (-) Transcript_60457:1196-2461(-)